MPTRQQVEDVLIETYSKEMRPNPRWDRKKASDNDWREDPDNPEFLPATREERVRESTWVVFTAEDGFPAIAPARINEIVQVLVDAGLVEP